jgi:hypothetical protein
MHESGQLSMQTMSAAQAAVQASGVVEDWGKAVTAPRRSTRRVMERILLVGKRVFEF